MSSGELETECISRKPLGVVGACGLVLKLERLREALSESGEVDLRADIADEDFLKNSILAIDVHSKSSVKMIEDNA